MSLNIVILDGIYTNPGDLSWEPIEKLGNVTLYDHTKPEEVIDRSKEADVVIINKIKLDAEDFDQLPNLKMVAISATGTDNVDLEAAKARNIVVKNAVGYSTNSVAQHVFSLLLALTNKVMPHNHSIQEGEWHPDKGFSYTITTIPELAGRTMGIYGFGKIGQKVAEIARTFGMSIMVVSNHAQPDDYPDYQIVSLETLFEQSDVVSLHAPAREDNQGIVNSSLLSKMKPTSYLINTARGALINEEDLRDALIRKQFAGAGLDVLTEEPPGDTHPLIGLDNCLLTPHMAWTTQESRRELIRIVAENIVGADL